MPIGRLGNNLKKRIEALEENVDSGHLVTLVTGTSTGFGGSSPPVFVPTNFLVKAAVGNLAKEYDLRDASQIYNFGDDVFAGEMKVTLPGTGTGFLVDYRQLDATETWELIFNWYATG